MLRLTGVSFVSAWRCSRGQVVRLVTGAFSHNAAAAQWCSIGASSPRLWLKYKAVQANQSAHGRLHENGEPVRDQRQGERVQGAWL